MPVDISAILARKGTRGFQAQSDIAVVSICCIVALAGVTLALVSDALSGTLLQMGAY